MSEEAKVDKEEDCCCGLIIGILLALIIGFLTGRYGFPKQAEYDYGYAVNTKKDDGRVNYETEFHACQEDLSGKRIRLDACEAAQVPGMKQTCEMKCWKKNMQAHFSPTGPCIDVRDETGVHCEYKPECKCVIPEKIFIQKLD